MTDEDRAADHTRRGVRETYEEIGEHFAKTRAHPWPEVEDFVADLEPREIGLDIGCGNGRHTELLAGVVEQAVGVDASRALLDTARSRAAEAGWRATFCQADAANLPIADGAVDCAVYIATIHHLPERETRVASLDELARVLAPGGTALVSAWATEHERFADEVERLVDEDRRSDPDDTETGFDTTVSWTMPDGETVPRYYHVYAPAEFEADLARSLLEIDEAYVNAGNCYARVSVEQ